MKLTMLFVISLILLCSCSDPPDVPSCRTLETKPETKEVPGFGKITLQRPNPVCEKKIKEIRCGYCVWTISDKEQYVGEAKETWLYKKPWSKLEEQAVKMPPEAYAEFKAWVINMCKKSNECNAKITHWRVKLDALDSLQ